jgi:hypothetical protein
MAAFAASQVLNVPQGVWSRWLKAQGYRLG